MKNAAPENGMREYAAFLRGINVGGHSIIKMDDLRKAFESMGFREVRTVMASGNVLFLASEKETMAISSAIMKYLSALLGREIFVIVRSLDDLRKLAAGRPFGDDGDKPGARLFVTFFSGSAGHGGGLPAPEEEGYRILSVADGVICSVLYEKPGVGAVDLMGTVEKAFGQKVTTRSWNTIERLIK